jgi:hypothetical protein
VRLAPEMRWEQQRAPTADGWKGVAVRIRLAEGLAFAGTLDPGMIALLQLCRGERPLREIYQDLVRDQGWDGERMRPLFLKVIRGLVEQGFLLLRAA